MQKHSFSLDSTNDYVPILKYLTLLYARLRDGRLKNALDPIYGYIQHHGPFVEYRGGSCTTLSLDKCTGPSVQEFVINGPSQRSN